MLLAFIQTSIETSDNFLLRGSDATGVVFVLMYGGEAVENQIIFLSFW
jgi:hypothetical protein